MIYTLDDNTWAAQLGNIGRHNEKRIGTRNSIRCKPYLVWSGMIWEVAGGNRLLLSEASRLLRGHPTPPRLPPARRELLDLLRRRGRAKAAAVRRPHRYPSANQARFEFGAEKPRFHANKSRHV
jgi:hypothetical protein